MFDGDMGLIDGSLEILVVSGGHLERGSAGKEKNGWVGPQKKDLEVILLVLFFFPSQGLGYSRVLQTRVSL
jgi:hypothetical protein